MNHSNLRRIRRNTPTKHRRRIHLALATGMAVGFAVLTLSARAQQPAGPATLEEALKQIEALKKQMSDLEKFVREQSQQRGANTSPSTPATTQPAAGPASDKATESGFVKWNELVTSKSKFKLYGFLRGDMIYDDSRPGGAGANSSLVPAFILSENGFGGAANLAPSRNHENILFHHRCCWSCFVSRRSALDCLSPEVSVIWSKTKRLTVEVLVANTRAVSFWRSVGYADYALSLEAMDFRRKLGASDEHIPQWICKERATTRLRPKDMAPFGSR